MNLGRPVGFGEFVEDGKNFGRDGNDHFVDESTGKLRKIEFRGRGESFRQRLGGIWVGGGCFTAILGQRRTSRAGCEQQGRQVSESGSARIGVKQSHEKKGGNRIADNSRLNRPLFVLISSEGVGR